MFGERAPIFREHEIEWDDRKVSQLWNYYSRTPPYSDIYFSKLFGNHILRLSGLPLRAPLEVLDFGCGPGFIWDHLSAMHARWNYTALDFSLGSIEKLIAKASGQEHFRGANHISLLPTPLDDNHFDVILLLEVVEHLSDPYLAATLNEVSRVLKHGGVVVITTPNDEDLSKSKKCCPECGAIFHEWQHVRSWNVATLVDRLAQAGFKMRTAKTLDFSTHGLTTHATLKKLANFARRLLRIDPGTPHMLAVFQKD